MKLDESRIIIHNLDGTYTYIDKNTNDKVTFETDEVINVNYLQNDALAKITQKYSILKEIINNPQT